MQSCSDETAMGLGCIKHGPVRVQRSLPLWLSVESNTFVVKGDSLVAEQTSCVDHSCQLSSSTRPRSEEGP